MFIWPDNVDKERNIASRSKFPLAREISSEMTKRKTRKEIQFASDNRGSSPLMSVEVFRLATQHFL